jgi:hypothetical protein
MYVESDMVNVPSTSNCNVFFNLRFTNFLLNTVPAISHDTNQGRRTGRPQHYVMINYIYIYIWDWEPHPLGVHALGARAGDAHCCVKLSLRLQANEATASRVAEAAPTVQHGTAELNPTSSTERH